MAKRTFVVLALLPLLARAADLSAGAVELTGSSNLEFSSSSNEVKASAPSISPSTSTSDTTTYGLGLAGIFYLTPNVGLGLRGSYGNVDSKMDGEKSSMESVGIGPVVAFELPLRDRLALAAQGSIGWLRTTWSGAGSPSLKASGYDVVVGAGVKYYVAKTFSLNGGLAYTYQKLDYTFSGLGSSSAKGTASSLGATVGLSVYFGQ